MNIRIGLLFGVLISGLALGAPLPDLSDFRYFLIYPHLERGRQALQNHDEARALHCFEHAHSLAPQSVTLTLWMAKAWRHFGYDDQAKTVLDEQLRHTPRNIEVYHARQSIPEPELIITSPAQLVALQDACDADPTVHCRVEVSNNALRLRELNIAKSQLQDRAFRHTPRGRVLLNALAQKAISVQQWALADWSFARIAEQQMLSEAQCQQWFAILLHRARDDRILDLQRQGTMNSPGMQLAYAQSLAQRGESKRLKNYLAGHHPKFDTKSEERNWRKLRQQLINTPKAVQ